MPLHAFENNFCSFLEGDCEIRPAGTNHRTVEELDLSVVIQEGAGEAATEDKQDPAPPVLDCQSDLEVKGARGQDQKRTDDPAGGALAEDKRLYFG